MINPMLYIVPSNAYGGAFAPLPITNVLPSTEMQDWGAPQDEPSSDTKTSSDVFEEIKALKERVAALEILQTISDPNASTDNKEIVQFQSQKYTFDEVKDSNGGQNYTKCDVAMIGDTLFFKFSGQSKMQSMKVWNFELNIENEEKQSGVYQVEGHAKIQDLSKSTHYVEISANKRESTILKQMQTNFETNKTRQTQELFDKATKVKLYFAADQHNRGGTMQYEKVAHCDVVMIGQILFFRFDQETEIRSMKVFKIDHDETKTKDQKNFESTGRFWDLDDFKHCLFFQANHAGVLEIRQMIENLKKLKSK